MELASVWLEALRDQGFSGTRNVIGRMLQTEVVYPSGNTLSVSVFTNV
jgi:hypothetical protein